MGKSKVNTILVGGRSPQQRKARPSDWSGIKARLFVEALAETCNVTLAAKAAGVSTGAAYRHRAMEAGFRAQWRRALATAYAGLELTLLERALHGVEKVVSVRNGEPTVMREYNDRTGLTLLRMHRDSAEAEDSEVHPSDHQDAMDRIVSRLQRVRKRQQVETKALPDRLALIRLGLKQR